MGLTMIRLLLSLLLLTSLSANAQFAPDYLIHPTSTCSASQFVQYQTLGSPATCGGISAVSPLTTKGDVFVFGSANDRLPVGTNNYILTPDSAQSLGMKWQSLTAQMDAVLGTSTQGYIVYRGASVLEPLAPNAISGGKALISGGTGANPSWVRSMVKKGEVNTTGTGNQTTMTLSGLDQSADLSYFCRLLVGNASGASTNNISIYYNSDTTATNYDRQAFLADNATLSAARSNSAILASVQASTYGEFWFWVTWGVDARVTMILIGQDSAGGANNVTIRSTAHRWRTASTNVTAYVVSGSVASAILDGSSLACWNFDRG